MPADLYAGAESAEDADARAGLEAVVEVAWLGVDHFPNTRRPSFAGTAGPGFITTRCDPRHRQPTQPRAKMSTGELARSVSNL